MKLVSQLSILICVISVYPPLIAPDYSKFSHSTEKHQQACNTCHKPYADAGDYPDHDACVSCHRRQFFRGARPQICSVCHSKTSPRDDARFAFRKPESVRQFTIDFPHNTHQDLIGFSQAQNYNNCTVCHATRTATFKAVPTEHASCFNCHWKSQEAVAANCNGCHKRSPAPHTIAASPRRISAKFIHDGGGEKKDHVAECTTCHIHITKDTSVRGLKPDVPITACTGCHNKVGLREDLNKELIAVDKNREFACTYCHAPSIGTQDAPASHYLIAERVPLKRKDIK